MNQKLNRRQSSALVDGLLKVVATGGVITIALAAPNLLKVLDKPMRKFFDAMDENSRQREIQRTINYMKQKKLIKYARYHDYKHGLAITEQGSLRIANMQYKNLRIQSNTDWDGSWRMVFFDIPEHLKTSRNAFTAKIKSLGFWQLQRSVWIHPLPCRDEIFVVADRHNISKYITYVETSHIDNDAELKKIFQKTICNDLHNFEEAYK